MLTEQETMLGVYCVFRTEAAAADSSGRSDRQVDDSAHLLVRGDVTITMTSR